MCYCLFTNYANESCDYANESHGLQRSGPLKVVRLGGRDGMSKGVESLQAEWLISSPGLVIVQIIKHRDQKSKIGFPVSNNVKLDN